MDDCCVYVHRKATDGAIFYVGKGRANRANDRIGRSSEWHEIVARCGYVVEIVIANISDMDARAMEFALINELADRGTPLVNKRGLVERKSFLHVGAEYEGEIHYPWRNVAFPHCCYLSIRKMVKDECATADELEKVLSGELFVTHDGWTINRSALK